MTSLLIIIVLVLLAIALWQLTKIIDLFQVGSDLDDSQVALMMIITFRVI
jgi:cytochrome c oxidase subunit 2